MNKVILPKQKAITIFLVFALGYYISNLLRAITATISPNLVSEFNLSAGDLGLLGGGYFLGFASVQIPLGYLLDNKGPKKIVSSFLLSRTRSVIVVEHDMEFIRQLECRVTVLHEGAVLAEGSLDFVTRNQDVIDVYLGR